MHLFRTRSRRLALAAGALAMTTLCGRSASAAPGPELPILGGPSSIQAGVFVPNGGDSKDRGGSTQLIVDFRYTVPVPNPFVVPTRTTIDLGVETGARQGHHSTVIPITVAQLFGANGQSPSAPNNFYFGLGGGVYIINQSNLSTATRIGGLVQAGYNITSTVFIDGKYQFVSHANGLSVTAGLRF